MELFENLKIISKMSIYLSFPELFFFFYSLFFFILLFCISIRRRFFKFPILIKILIILYSQIIFHVITLFLNNISYSYNLFLSIYISNNFIVILKIIFLSFFFIYLLFLYEYARLRKIFILEFVFLLTTSMFSCILAFSANDFLILYLLIELQNICVYILISLKRSSSFAIESAIKYFFISAIMMGFFLYGISLCYFSSGIINFYDFELFLYFGNCDFIFLIGFFFILMSLLIKNGVPPFHLWLLDVYAGCSLYILFYFLIFLKFFYFSLIFRIYSIFLEIGSNFIPDFMLVCGFLSVLFGVLGGLYQIKLSKLFIFSSISNSSFFLFLFLLNVQFIKIYFIYFSLLYLLNMLAIYIILSSFVNWSNMKELNKLSNFSNIFQINFYYFFVISLCLIYLSGFPPFAGFFYKFFILHILINTNLFIFGFFILILYTLSFFYYIRIIKIMLLNKHKQLLLLKPVSYLKIYTLFCILLINFYFIIFQNFILNILFEWLI